MPALPAFRLFAFSLLACLGGMFPRAHAQTPPPPPAVIERPLEVWWGGYKGSQQLVGAGATQWDFVRRHMDGFILHGAYWNYPTNNFGAPSPDVVGPQLAPLINQFSKPVIVEHLLAGEYPDIDSSFGAAFAGNVSDPAGFGSAIANIKRLQNYGFPRPDVSSDFIMNSWQEAVRFHPEWTSREFFTALTGAWETYTGDQFDATPGSADRLRYGWFRQWVERLATAFPGIKVTATNSPVYLPWTEAGDTRRELGGSLNNFHTWLKLERRGDTVTALYSGDGYGWAPLGSAAVPLGASPRAGLYTASADPARLAQARFTDVRVLPVFTADIGKTGRGGTVAVSGSTYTVTGRGNDFTHPGNNTSDAQFYAWRDWTGDGAFTVRLDSLVGSNPGRTNPAGELPTAGLTLRESSAPDARQVSLHANLANQLQFRARTTAGGGLAHVAGSGSPLAATGVTSTPRWLRLTRSGNSLTAAHSVDGVSWTTLPASASVALPSTIQVGLVADSQVRFETATAVFSQVSFLAAPSLAFSGADVGSAGAGATSSVSGGTTTLKAGGDGFANGATQDSLRLHSTAWSGDGTLIARLAWFADDASPATALAAAAQMGITVRASSAADAPAVAIAFTPRQGLRTFARTAATAPTSLLATYGVDEVSIQPLGGNYRPLLHYFTGNAYLAGLHEAFPDSSPFRDNYAGFTTDSPYGDYQKWGGSETHPDALRHRRKIILYERWLQARGRVHDFIANSTGADFSGFNTATQSGRDAWDLRYKQHSLRSLQLHQLEGGRPDKAYLESWYDGPFTLVPENQNGTFTNLVRDALYYVKGIDQSLSLTALTPASAQASAMGAPLTYTVRLQNTGTVPALPVLHAHETGGPGWAATYTLGGVDITSSITSASGHAVTAAALYTGNELVAPGASLDLTVTLTPNAALASREILLRAFWNPQDPSATARASLTLTATPPAQLLANRDAEAGSTLGWMSNGGGSVSLDTTVFRSGAASIRGNRSQPYQGPAQTMLGRLLPGQTYRLTAWVRLSSGPHDVKATLAYTGAAGPTIFNGLQTVPATATSWTPLDVTFRYTEPNGPATALVLYFEGPPAGVALHVDDASLVLVPPAWTQSAAGIHFFSTAANWSPASAPVSSPLYPLNFFPGQTLPAVTLTATQDAADPFQSSAVDLGGSGAAAFTLTGSAIETRALTLSAQSAAYTVATPLRFPGDALVSGEGAAAFTLAAPLTSPGALRKSGASTLTLAAANDFPGTAFINAGVLRAAHPSALGSATAATVVQGGAALAALELSGGITVTEPVQFVMHNTPGHIQLRNVSGHNTLAGPLSLNSGGARWDFVSLAGSLTLTGPIINIAPGTDTWRTLHLHGPGSGTITGALTDSATGASKLNLTVLSGAWTLSGVAKAHTGATTLAGGTLHLDTSLASTLAVQTGATLGLRLRDWASPAPAVSVAQLSDTGASAWTLHLDATDLVNFSETARTFPLVVATRGIVDVAPAAITVTTTAFPGTGGFSLTTTADTLALVYSPDPYVAWSATIPWPPPAATSSAPTADPDGDGLPNLLEYSLDSDPLAPSASSLILNAETHLRVTFLRARPELLYEVLASSTLAPGSWEVIATNPGDVGATVTVTDTLPLADHPRRFLRLRVSIP